MRTGITRSFQSPYFTGSSASAVDVGTVYDVALGGRGYMLDLNHDPSYGMRSLPLLERYSITRDPGALGERSLNPEDYWRRSVDSWDHGSGQTNNDHDTSVRERFRLSKGIDCWTVGRITLLKDTSHLLTTSATNVFATIAGTYLYVLDGNALKFTTATSFSTTTGTTPTTPVSIASDGNMVWFVDSTATYYTTRGNAAHTAYHASSSPATLVRVAKGRLFTAASNIVYTHSGTAGSAVATAYFTHPNSDFTWVDVAEGPVAIYFAGYSGDKSIIYQTQIESDGTDLSVPTAAAELPSGEIVRAIKGYLGLLVIGTDKGVRIAQMDNQGNLTLGDIITTNTSVRCFEPNGNFVWFGWTNYDTTSTGLGRLSLGTFNGAAPSYATDLMATAQGIVSSVVTFGGLRVYSVQGSGLWAEHATNKVSSGTIYSGWLNYELADPKIAIKFGISYLAGAGTITAALSADNATTYTQMGSAITTLSTAGDNQVLPAGMSTGRVHEILLTLTRSSGDASQAPIIDRWTLLVNPAPERRELITVPIRLVRSMQRTNGSTITMDPLFERQAIAALMQTNQVVTFQDAETSYPVTVDDYQWEALHNTDARVRSWDGTMTVILKVTT